MIVPAGNMWRGAACNYRSFCSRLAANLCHAAYMPKQALRRLGNPQSITFAMHDVYMVGKPDA